MSTIICVLFKGEKRIGKSVFNNILDSLSNWNPDDRYAWSNDKIMLGNLLMNTTPQSIKENKSCFYTDSHCTIISDSRLDYRRELVHNLDEDWDVFKEYPDNFYILKSYQKWGKECVNHLYGDFAFVIWDNCTNELFCARDHFGIRPLYYSDQPDFFLVSSDFMAFKCFPDFIYQIDEEFIVNSILTIIPDKHSSAYIDINKLKPAHSLLVHSSGNIKILKYWNLEVDERFSNLDEKSAIFGLRKRFIESIENKMSSSVETGIELSGGLDSSSIAKCLSDIQGKQNTPIRAFIHTMDPEQKVRPKIEFDAYELCRKIFGNNRQLKLIKISGLKKQGCYHALSDFLDIVQRPIVQDFALMSDLLYDEAQKQGVRILFSGYGGDEGITHNEVSYPAGYEKKWAEYKAVLERNPNKIDESYIRSRIKFAIRKYAPWFIKIKKSIFPKNDISYKELHKIIAIHKVQGRRKVMSRRYLDYIDFPKEHDVRQKQYRRINFRHISDRAENSYYAARQRRIEYRYPFLDVKLLEYYYSLKSEYKFKGGVKRHLFKMAMKGILDDRIRLRPEKIGFAIPNVRQRMMEDDKWLKDTILDCRTNNSTHYVDYNQLLWILNRIIGTSDKKEAYIPVLAFIPAFSILLLQKWQREGKIDIGIKC